MSEGRHVGPIRTTEVLYSEGVYVERDPGSYVGRHRLTRIWHWREELDNWDRAFRVNGKKPT